MKIEIEQKDVECSRLHEKNRKIVKTVDRTKISNKMSKVVTENEKLTKELKKAEEMMRDATTDRADDDALDQTRSS